MISKTSVIGMFLDRHQLNSVISEFNYSGKHDFDKILKRMHFFFNSCHSYMRFINFHNSWFWWPLAFKLELLRIPKYTIEEIIFNILPSLVNPCRNSVNPFTTSIKNISFNFRIMRYHLSSIFLFRKKNFPIS